MSKQLPLYPALNPTEYLKIADELKSRAESFALRTAADRAYFAAYLTCRDILAEKDYFTPNYDTDDHPGLTSALKRRDVLGSWGNQEFRLRRARNRINYWTCDIDSSTKDARPVNWMLETAREIISRVEALPHRSQKR
jgi:hypothetical protein